MVKKSTADFDDNAYPSTLTFHSSEGGGIVGELDGDCEVGVEGMTVGIEGIVGDGVENGEGAAEAVAVGGLGAGYVQMARL